MKADHTQTSATTRTTSVKAARGESIAGPFIIVIARHKHSERNNAAATYIHMYMSAGNNVAQLLLRFINKNSF